MALGVDLWWADAVLRAGLILAAYVPCPPNPRWSTGDRREYERLLSRADPVLSRQFADRYHPDVMGWRNEAMVRDSAAVVAVWLPSKRAGGTWHAVRLAVALAMPGVHIDPAAQAVHLGQPYLRLRARPVVGSPS